MEGRQKLRLCWFSPVPPESALPAVLCSCHQDLINHINVTSFDIDVDNDDAHHSGDSNSSHVDHKNDSLASCGQVNLGVLIYMHIHVE